jgi:hypothetical protein
VGLRGCLGAVRKRKIFFPVRNQAPISQSSPFLYRLSYLQSLKLEITKRQSFDDNLLDSSGEGYATVTGCCKASN